MYPAKSFTAAVANIVVRPKDEMTSPYGGMNVFARDRLPKGLVSFRALCGVQSSPLVFAPNRAFF